MIDAIITLLKPAPHLPEILDKTRVRKRYSYWRIRTFYSMYAGYLLYYFSRKSFTFITPFLTTDIGLSKGDIGLLGTIFALVYGSSKFASGLLSDRANPRYVMAIGLIITGLCNIGFGFSFSLLSFSIFWGLNACFQGWGWPACTKQLTQWFSRSERGRWWSIFSTSHNVGGFLIAYLASYSAQWFGWRYGMWVPGILCVVAGIWLLNRLRDVPQSLGLPDVERYKREPLIEKQGTGEVLSMKEILWAHVLNNKYVWLLSIASFFVYVVRVAVNDLGTLYLSEVKGYGAVEAAACISFFEVGGFFGILTAGWGSDYWFQGRRVPMIILYSLGLVFAVFGLSQVAPQATFLTAGIVSIIGFLVFGPQMLVGLSAAELVSKKAASTSNGFAGCFAYFGAAVAGYPLGKLVDLYGWSSFIAVLVICAAAAVAILLPIWSVTKGTDVEEEETLFTEDVD